MKFMFAERPWESGSWYLAGSVVDGRAVPTIRTKRAMESATGWGACVRSMVRDLEEGRTNIGPHCVTEDSEFWDQVPR